MKSTGIVRRIDDLGRYVIPKEIRRTLGIKEGDPVELYIMGDKIVLAKYTGTLDTETPIAQLREVLADKPGAKELLDKLEAIK